MLGQLSGVIEDGYFESGKLRIVFEDGVPEVYLDSVLVEAGYKITITISDGIVSFVYTYEEQDGIR